MGRPIANKNFGNLANKIQVSYFNGTDVSIGYIIKQLGSKKFLIGGFAGNKAATGAPATYVCTLRQTTGAPVAGECIITGTAFGGSAKNVVNISTFRVKLDDGTVCKYKLGTAAAAAGEATVLALTAPVTNATD